MKNWFKKILPGRSFDPENDLSIPETVLRGELNMLEYVLRDDFVTLGTFMKAFEDEARDRRGDLGTILDRPQDVAAATRVELQNRMISGEIEFFYPLKSKINEEAHDDMTASLPNGAVLPDKCYIPAKALWHRAIELHRSAGSIAIPFLYAGALKSCKGKDDFTGRDRLEFMRQINFFAYENGKTVRDSFRMATVVMGEKTFSIIVPRGSAAYRP